MVAMISDLLLQSSQRKATPPGMVRRFLEANEIAQSITMSKNFSLDGTDPNEAFALLFFQTRKQQTWLVRTGKRLYCILDDIRKPAPHINWSMAMDDVVNTADNTLKVEIGVRERSNVSRSSGLLDIGSSHRDWLYSKKLFASESPKARVERFLVNG